MKINFDNPTPIYVQIIDEMKRALARGELKPGEKIPSQRERAKLSKINPNTVQRAYREMELIGITVTNRGKGTFITTDLTTIQSIRNEMANVASQTFVEEMTSLGFQVEQIQQYFEDFLKIEQDREEGRNDE
ncbi:GntR family transcriptional regulator [Bacillus spongiae]|uniref:GntR family transcriptional regulator n=1 Tax=Bacillus spongiae TaxID=2683610 RepID=A0ABU8HCE3_9BACI